MWLKKYWKQLLIALFAGFVVLSAVLGEGWSDYAEKPFWQNTWLKWQIVCIAGIGILWAMAWTSKRNK